MERNQSAKMPTTFIKKKNTKTSRQINTNEIITVSNKLIDLTSYDDLIMKTKEYLSKYKKDIKESQLTKSFTGCNSRNSTKTQNKTKTDRGVSVDNTLITFSKEEEDSKRSPFQSTNYIEYINKVDKKENYYKTLYEAMKGDLVSVKEKMKIVQKENDKLKESIIMKDNSIKEFLGDKYNFVCKDINNIEFHLTSNHIYMNNSIYDQGQLYSNDQNCKKINNINYDRYVILNSSAVGDIFIKNNQAYTFAQYENQDAKLVEYDWVSEYKEISLENGVISISLESSIWDDKDGAANYYVLKKDGNVYLYETKKEDDKKIISNITDNFSKDVPNTKIEMFTDKILTHISQIPEGFKGNCEDTTTASLYYYFFIFII